MVGQWPLKPLIGVRIPVPELLVHKLSKCYNIRMKTSPSNKELILDLFKNAHLLNANDIVQKMKSQMDRATVYRNLSKMVIEGLLKELNIEKGIISYELSSSDHQHFICKNCDKVIPVEIDTEKLNKLVESDQFQPQDIELNISGICSTCK